MARFVELVPVAHEHGFKVEVRCLCQQQCGHRRIDAAGERDNDPIAFLRTMRGERSGVACCAEVATESFM